MKGEKIYNLAKAVHEEMYAKSHQADEKMILFTRYFELIRKAAYKGHIESLYTMGNLYEDIGYLGIPNPLHNPKKALYWYTKACEKGHSEACNNLANLYELGAGCHRNLDVALDFYKQAASGGSPNGKKNYRLMLKDMSKGGKYNK
jgi:TPR repeat protein